MQNFLVGMSVLIISAIVCALSVRGLVAFIRDVCAAALAAPAHHGRGALHTVVPQQVVATRTGGKFHHHSCGDVRNKTGTQILTPCSKCEALFVVQPAVVHAE